MGCPVSDLWRLSVLMDSGRGNPVALVEFLSADAFLVELALSAFFGLHQFEGLSHFCWRIEPCLWGSTESPQDATS